MMLLDTHVWLRWLGVGNAPLPAPLVDLIEDAETAPISAVSVWEAAWLDIHHRDPADRFIIATALELDCRLLSLDAKFPLYGELAGRLVQA